MSSCHQPSVSSSNPAGRLVLDGQVLSDRVVDSVAMRLIRNLECGPELVHKWRAEIKDLREENRYALGYLSTLERCSCAPPKKATRRYNLKRPRLSSRVMDAIVDPDGDLGDDCFDDFDEAIIAPLSNPVLQKYTMVNADVMKEKEATPVILHSKVGTGKVKKQPPSSPASSVKASTVWHSAISVASSNNTPRSTTNASPSPIDDDDEGDEEGFDSDNGEDPSDDKEPPTTKMLVYGYTARRRAKMYDWGKRNGMARCYPYYGFVHLCGSSIEWFYPTGDVLLDGFFRKGKKEVRI